MTIATDRHGTGTNCLLCPTDGGVVFGYGPASRRWHQSQAQALDMRCEAVALPGMGCDIDTPEDLLVFLNHSNPSAGQATRDYLASSGIARQLLLQEDA